LHEEEDLEAEAEHGNGSAKVVSSMVMTMKGIRNEGVVHR
jgi:hypothetical protein